MNFKIGEMVIPLSDLPLAAQSAVEVTADEKHIRLDVNDRDDGWRKIIILGFNERGDLELNVWSRDRYAQLGPPDETIIVLSASDTREDNDQGEVPHAGLD